LVLTPGAPLRAAWFTAGRQRARAQDAVVVASVAARGGGVGEDAAGGPWSRSGGHVGQAAARAGDRQTSGRLRRCWRNQGRHLVPDAALEQLPGLLLVRPAPLLEEERDSGGQALVADLGHPAFLDRTGAGAGLADGNRPAEVIEVDLAADRDFADNGA